MTHDINDIKSKLDLVDIVGEYVKLTSSGGNFRGLCPFHKEKSPSFMVSREKQIWHCFGCGKGGDVFKFIMGAENVGFGEALKILAPKAGIELNSNNYDHRTSSERTRYLEVLDISSRYYHENLIRSPFAQKACEYLRGRGLNENGLIFWRIGYSNDSWDDLILMLRKKGFSDDDILGAGMSVKKDGAYRFYNRFRGRIMFPIFDTNGQVVAFTARVSPDKEAGELMGKYINSPETSLYSKSKTIFALNFAKTEIKKTDKTIVVEGQMDAITAHENGFMNVVASSGTAFTRSQLGLLKRYSNNIVFAFDADAAGEMAAERAIDAAIETEMNVSVIKIENGKDPDECIRQDVESWRRSVENSQKAMDYFFDKNVVILNSDGIENKKKIAAKLLPKIVKIVNTIERDYWIKKLSEVISVDENILREEANKYSGLIASNKKKEDEFFSDNVELGRAQKLSRSVLALLINFPFLCETALNRLSIDKIFGGNEKQLYNHLLIYYTTINSNGAEQSSFQDFQKYLQDIQKDIVISQLLTELAFSGEKDFNEFTTEEVLTEILSIISELNKIYLCSLKKEKEKMLALAESAGDNNKALSILHDLQKLNFEMSNL